MCPNSQPIELDKLTFDLLSVEWQHDRDSCVGVSIECFCECA